MRPVRDIRDFIYSALGAVILGGVMAQLIIAIAKAVAFLYIIFGKPNAF